MLTSSLNISAETLQPAARTPVNLIDAGWTFAAELTTDQRWMVLGRKGDVRISSQAPHLGAAFQDVEREALRQEGQSIVFR